MSEIKLAKCPFCNGEAHIEEHKFWDEKAKGFTVQTYGVVCDNCCSMSWQHHRHKEKAIEQWNTRRPIERIVERQSTSRKWGIDMYYIWDNYHEEWYYISFYEFEDAEREMQRLIETCKSIGKSYDYDIYQKVT